MENNLTPDEFQNRLNDVAGWNRYDEPNFLIVWGQGGHPESTFRAGGVWSVDESYYLGYRDLLKTSGEPCWCLLQWHDSLEYGTPESYYVNNYDETTSLQILGEYPYTGRYETLFNMRHKELIPGEGIKFEMMPLSNFILETIIPIILEAKNISVEKRMASYEYFKEQEEIAKLSAVEKSIREAALPFKDNAVSYTRQGIRTSSIDTKVINMTRHWGEISDKARKLKKGLQTSAVGIK